ncbi:conserved hypothetical protein [Roseovarius sp. EC-HK134]|uniref:DUF927 domain-containing protein n=1 Tax=unclassified Roseovarius TaxID=2614913 RepID=UPI00125C29F1|nr:MULTISPECIES: DUF927 domain-containing protein [unclassified Roseovarius]VVT16318.1 conserved hypothetical protein [Roseovarius sp. EC-HK134]VVT16962.1 conserved hypothetical protein [Roseovarius sp. EC-SD190]
MDGNFSKDMDPIISHIPPPGFVARLDGIYIERVGKDDEVTLDWLCSPIAVKALGRNKNNEHWCSWIELVDADGIVHELHVLEENLGGSFSKVLKDLRCRGFRLAGGKAARESLVELLMNWKPARRYYTTDRLGWTDSSCANFVLGNKRVLGDEEMVFLNDAASSRATEMRSSGTLEDWRAAVAQRCSGNPVMLVAVSLAFAGPLVGFLGRESFGLHLCGDPGNGKTTTAKAAVSVWGSPNFMHSWRTTANALEGTAATCNGSLLVLDELAAVSGREVGDAVYMLGNGEGKGRATATGDSIRAHRWSLTFLSTGEISLAKKMGESGKTPMAGQNVRLINIIADARLFGAFDNLHGETKSEIFAKSVEDASASCFGVAGQAFVERLIKTPGLREKATRALQNIISRWKSELDLPSDRFASRVLGHFALIGVAGHLATVFGLTGWQKGEAHRAAFELAKKWLEAQDRPEKLQVDAAVERTREYLVAHGDTHFQRAGQPPVTNLAGYRDDDWFYILGDTWSALHAGLSPTEEAKRLAIAGFFVHGDGKNIQSKSPGWVPGRPRAYKVRASIIDMASIAKTLSISG